LARRTAVPKRNVLFKSSSSETIRQSSKKRFIGQQHRLQTKYVLGEAYPEIHKKMDRARGGGAKHRTVGHDREYIEKSFQGKERLAAAIHLLGDFALDVMPRVIGLVVEQMTRQKLPPPYYLKGLGDWDVNLRARGELVEGWSRQLVQALAAEGRRDEGGGHEAGASRKR
jgi:hypothetical protein